MAGSAASTAPDLPERVGRYHVLGRLESGGMAEILLGQVRGPSGFEHPVVIKRILPHLARDRSFVSMFLDEARIAAGVRHPNVVHVHELGQEGDDLFLVMEYLEGESVLGIGRRAVVRGMFLDPMMCAYVVAEACAGLHAAHELKDPNGEPRNVVHRDVSPSNIHLTYTGNVKVLDFGIAKAADRMTKTDAGLVKGKFAYMSPEQCRGEPLDRRSDVFALGICLYEMLTGRRLFQRPTQAATIQAVLQYEIIPPSELAPGIPPAIEAVCMKALSRSRRRRFDTASAMRRELLRVVHTSSDEASPEDRVVALLSRLFSDRIAEKGDMLRRVEQGEDIGEIPLTVGDVEIEIPGVDVAPPVSSIVARAAPAEGRRGRAWWLVAATLLAVGAGLWFSGVFAPVEHSEPTQPVGDGEGALDDEVEIRIGSTPPGAQLSVDGEPRGETPIAVVLPRGDEPVELRLSLAGHEPLAERVVPDVAQRLRLSLTPVEAEEEATLAETAATEAPVARMTPRASRMRRARRGRMARTTAPAAMGEDPDRFRRWD